MHWVAWILAFAVMPALGRPVVFWGSDPVHPGEIALLIGDGFGVNPHVEVARLADDPIGFQVEQEETVVPLQGTDQSLKLEIPKTFKEGVYQVRICTGKDETSTWLLNKPTVYWIQGDQGRGAAPGGWIRVFGRNVGYPPESAILMLTSLANGSYAMLRAEQVSPWEVHFEVPESLAPGLYEVRLYNGKGGQDAWAEAGRLEIGIAKPWPGQLFNVKKYGAVGDGQADDTGAIDAAIAAAGNNGGGVVYFPRGRYLVKKAIFIPPYVTLKGERRDLVSLIWPDMDDPPLALIHGANHFALEDLTFYATRYRNVIVGDIKPSQFGEPGHVRIQRITVRAVRFMGHLTDDEVAYRSSAAGKISAGGDTLRLGGVGLVITDCDFYGSGRALYLYRPRGAYVARNRFYNGRRGWYSLSGADGLIFEDNEIVGGDLMSTGGGINTLGRLVYSQNILFARNRLRLFHGWDREAMTTDGPGGYYYGPVRSVMSDVIELSDSQGISNEPPEQWKGAGVFILGGKGMGQYAQVEKLEGRLVTLDRSWKVRPDASSVVTITPMQQNYLFIDNEFSDAGVAIQYYGTSVNHVAVGNKSIRTSGFFSFGRWYHHYQPSWYNQFLENEILEGNFYRGGPNNVMLSGEAIMGTMGLQKPPNIAPLALAAVYRRNLLYSNAHFQFEGGGDGLAPGLREVLVENNLIQDANVGLLIGKGVLGFLARGNRFVRVKTELMREMP